MLTAIELSGFKSFADRTRLEFSDGISALVGPNGSGKSNVVDAIKWVLGEQSHKKLRATEATDVIFSGSAGRDALSAAEVTLTFDNTSRIFDLDTREVHITRRVYRSGEGEYLLNRQASRLRDIKELLAGTGLGTQAYSIIEQGRVESLLQSTPTQRRAIFEDAAGTSRFAAKKIEIGRRVERVEQNLVRISDIVTELEGQLKTTKLQAAKAEQYREWTRRLQQLRSEAARLDYQRLIAGLASAKSLWNAATAKQQELEASVEKIEAEWTACVAEIEQAGAAIHCSETQLAATRERATSARNTAQRLANQQSELDDEWRQMWEQVAAARQKQGDADDLARKTEQERDAAATAVECAEAVYQQLRIETESLATAVTEQQRLKDAAQKAVTQSQHNIQQCRSDVKRCDERFAAHNVAVQLCDKRRDALGVEREQLCEQAHHAATARDKLYAALHLVQSELDKISSRKGERLTKRETLLHELSELKQRHSALSEREIFLADLLTRHEGLSPGVKDVLKDAKNPESPFRHSHGLVADILHVDVADAMLIDVALGGKAQQVVVSPEPELFRHIEKTSQQFSGRVGFLWLDPRPADEVAPPSEQFHGRPGVVGRGDQFVRTAPAFASLAQRLLGHLWIVESLAVAKKLYRESDDRTSFLTVAGEMLESDGTLVVGPPHIASGLIARRSELRSVEAERTPLTEKVQQTEQSLSNTKQHLIVDDAAHEGAVQQLQNATKSLETQERTCASLVERLAELERQKKAVTNEAASLEVAGMALQQEQQQANDDEAIAARRHEVLSRQANDLVASLDEHESRLSTSTQQLTTAKIELAKSEERRNLLSERLLQSEQQRRERLSQRETHRRRCKQLELRRDTADLERLTYHAAIAMLADREVTLVASIQQQTLARQQLAETRKRRQQELKKRQNELQHSTTQTHTHQREWERLDQELAALARRVQEDYGVTLATLGCDDKCDTKPVDSQHEIKELREKIERLGSVNLEAVETLDAIKSRYDTLSQQYNDLLSSKKSMERLIERVDVDSRRMFEETFDGVRHHFREIFQQLFGGGNADLVLGNPDAPLDSGVEIVARPPGKELRSVMLMSGGEKTLTCVALLMAFFKFRPNPVCILDEVDAALDEGNIDRFVRVVRDFRLATQFLIVTHSKKTMACATTLYGITMQESGISKPISVRFVDVGENGEILSPPSSENTLRVAA